MTKTFLSVLYIISSFQQLYAADSDVNEKITMLCAEAECWIGTLEEGTNSGEIIEMFQRAVDGKASKEPWCMCFVQYCIKTTDQKYVDKYPDRPVGKSSIFCSEHCLTTWNKSPHLRIEKPIKGSVCIWQKFDGQKATTSGHTGIVVELHNDGTILVIEGNTSKPANGSIEREGDGVYLKHYTVGQMDRGALVLKGFLKIWS